MTPSSESNLLGNPGCGMMRSDSRVAITAGGQQFPWHCVGALVGRSVTQKALKTNHLLDWCCVIWPKVSFFDHKKMPFRSFLFRFWGLLLQIPDHFFETRIG